jgi:hypothetical protein
VTDENRLLADAPQLWPAAWKRIGQRSMAMWRNRCRTSARRRHEDFVAHPAPERDRWSRCSIAIRAGALTLTTQNQTPTGARILAAVFKTNRGSSAWWSATGRGFGSEEGRPTGRGAAAPARKLGRPVKARRRSEPSRRTGRTSTTGRLAGHDGRILGLRPVTANFGATPVGSRASSAVHRRKSAHDGL